MGHKAASSEQDHELLRQIGANITHYRRELGLTQEALAARLDISRAHLARVEIGIGAASLPLLFTLSTVLGVPLKALFDFPEMS